MQEDSLARAYFATLDPVIAKASSLDAYKKHIKALSRLYHPDKNPDRVAWANDIMKLINHHKEKLLDPEAVPLPRDFEAECASAAAAASFRRHGAHDEFVPAPTGQWVRANPETKRQKQKRLHNRKMYLLRRSKDPRISEGQRRYALEQLLREFPEHFT